MGAAAVLESRLVAVTPGSQASVQLRVRNTGSVVDQFSFQVLGDAQQWSTVAPPTLSLFPGAEEAATITFQPPRSPSVPAGQLPFGVHIISKEDPQGSVVEEGVLDVAPFSDVFAELAPRTSRGSRSASHDLAIDNRGNAPINTAISASDPDRLLNFDVRPPGVVAQPGTASFAKVAVRPTKRFWRGASQTRPFQVLLDGAGPAPVTVDGTMVQEAILPPWTMRALAILAAAIIALIAIWFLLLKPAIQSTAEQTTQQALAAVGITPPPGGFNQPPSNGGGGGGGPTPTPGPQSSGPPGTPNDVSNVPSAPALNGGGQPTDGLISFGGQSLHVPTGKTLYITDLVFSNPSDTATGSLRLQRSTTAGAPEDMLILQLQDFRSLDYHFVTPIVVAAGESLNLICDDPSQCSGPPAASVYYSGYLR